MNRSQLAQLYERVIAQDEYPGGVCPTELKMVEFVTRALPEPERQRLEAHLSECAGCQQAAEKLRTARRWFSENASLVFTGIPQKAADAGVEPWTSCPSDDILEMYALGALPETESGARFKARIERHLAACETCRQAAEQARGRLATLLTLRMADLQRHVSQAAHDTLRRMLLAIKAVAIAGGVGQRVRAMPGFRSQPALSLDALVLDRDGKMVLDHKGSPRKVIFDLIRGEVERDGHFVLDLSTADREYWEGAQQRYVVSATLSHENRRLILPAEKIYGDGRVTIVGNLPSGVEIRDLPTSTITLTLVREG